MFPNPFIDHLSVVINSKINDVAFITVFNAEGRELYKVQKNLISGQNTINLNDLNFTPGVYYMNIKRRIFNNTIPIVKAIK